jgi:hypothetical protein
MDDHPPGDVARRFEDSLLEILEADRDEPERHGDR